jgi:DNA invertase Pin-like site-specific DNA recombinase
MNTATIGYIRVSTAEQATSGSSLAAQESAIRAYCAMRGLELVAIITDGGVSATIPLAERPGGRQMFDALATSAVAHVVATKLDRLFRRVSDCSACVRSWDNAGVSLHLLDLGGQAVDTSSAMGRFFLSLMSAVSELERDQLSERITTVLAHKRSKGERWSKDAPFGSQWSANNTVEPCQPELDALEVMHTSQQAGHTLSEIAHILAECGITTRRGTAWTRSRVHQVLHSTSSSALP